VSFEEMLRTRSAAEYADFLLPHLDAGFHVLDAGCGAGTITVGLAERLTGGRVVGVDPSGDGFSEALRYAEDNGIGNVDLHVGDAYALDFPSDRFDACLCHSTLETLGDPLAGLVEIKRTLKPAGVLGVACVEYGGLILAGPGVDESSSRSADEADCGSEQITPRSPGFARA
jgi:ubiquinone/menaquinone biosynthesis C-methylase UbiE